MNGYLCNRALRLRQIDLRHSQRAVSYEIISNASEPISVHSPIAAHSFFKSNRPTSTRLDLSVASDSRRTVPLHSFRNWRRELHD